MTQLGIPFQAHSPTSAAAAESMEPTAGTLRARVLDHLRYSLSAGGTDEEIQEGLHMPPSTERPRRIELVRAGLVKDSGRTRACRSGRMAVVWVAIL